jgi:hypothetical protein
MADCTLMALLQATGQGDGLAADALANLSHIPLFQHLAAVLSKEDNYVIPEDAELAEVQTNYETNPELADQEVQQLLELRLSNPELFALELAEEQELREGIEAIVKQEELIRQGDACLARTRTQLATLHENSQAIRQQQQLVEQGLHRVNRAVEQRVAAAASRNASDNCTAQAVQECARVMQELLIKSAERWLLLAHPLDELREIEKAITAEISRCASAPEYRCNTVILSLTPCHCSFSPIPRCGRQTATIQPQHSTRGDLFSTARGPQTGPVTDVPAALSSTHTGVRLRAPPNRAGPRSS